MGRPLLGPWGRVEWHGTWQVAHLCSPCSRGSSHAICSSKHPGPPQGAFLFIWCTCDLLPLEGCLIILLASLWPLLAAGHPQMCLSVYPWPEALLSNTPDFTGCFSWPRTLSPALAPLLPSTLVTVWQPHNRVAL